MFVEKTFVTLQLFIAKGAIIIIIIFTLFLKKFKITRTVLNILTYITCFQTQRGLTFFYHVADGKKKVFNTQDIHVFKFKWDRKC